MIVLMRVRAQVAKNEDFPNGNMETHRVPSAQEYVQGIPRTDREHAHRILYIAKLPLETNKFSDDPG